MNNKRRLIEDLLNGVMPSMETFENEKLYSLSEIQSIASRNQYEPCWRLLIAQVHAGILPLSEVQTSEGVIIKWVDGSKLLAEQNSLLRIANCRREREVKEGFSFGYHSCNLLRTNCIWLSGPDSKESIQ